MSKHLELRRQRAAVLDVADGIVAAAIGEGRGLSDDEQRQVEGFKVQADKLEGQAKLAEEIGSMRSTATIVPPQAPAYIKRIGDDEGALYERWLRRGERDVERELRELRASNATDMNIGTAADGGVLVPTGLYDRIIARRDEQALHTQIGVTRIIGKGTTVDVPVDNEADGEFVATNEATENDLDAPAVAKVSLTKLTYTKQIKVSLELLDDESSNLMQLLPNWVARGWAKTYNQLLITEALANGTAALTLDAAAAIGAAEIPELAYKQASEYTEGSVWIMKRATEGYIRGLASSNQFLFNPTPAGSDRGRPEIWGFPVYNTEKMTGIQASAKSLIFGNFEFMGMYEDPGLTFMRDPYSLAYLRQVRLLYHFRVDFGVLQAEAINYATHPTA
jgi:HK97 family phage major capsid protein